MKADREYRPRNCTSRDGRTRFARLSSSKLRNKEKGGGGEGGDWLGRGLRCCEGGNGRKGEKKIIS